MQGLQVDINHLNLGVRYKFITNSDSFNPGNIFSGDYNRSILTNHTPPQRYLEFANCINETNGTWLALLSIPVNYIREIYATVSAPSSKLPASIGRHISSYGGRRNTKRKRVKSKNRNVKIQKTKRRNSTRRW
jgi:hypothetical protein